MRNFIRDSLIPNLLFAATLIVALTLVMLVLTASLFLMDDPHNRLLQLFAQDSTVRRTTLASSLGLAVTAFVFFRPGVLRGKSKPRRPPPPSALAGA